MGEASTTSPEGSFAPAKIIGSLGIVFGDIGTSPIYTFRECLNAAGQGGGKGADPSTVIDLLSLILWTLVIVVTLKYVVFVMRADNGGEGGIVALLGLAREAEPPSRLSSALLVAGLAGAALFFGDGMITPAISVLSAVEGLDTATPIFHPYIVPITVAVLVALFLVQSRGSARIGFLFGPVMVAWFALLALTGAAHLVAHPAVLQGLDPRRAVGFLATHGTVSLVVLGSAFLSVTGAEALYADMGHFGRGPIRLSWSALVLPALALNYLGQGAEVLVDGDALQNPFYRMFPAYAVYPVVALAALATVIASQAVISGAFSLAQQAIQVSLMPRLDVRQTSDEAAGQVYVPQINWILMVGVIGLVFGFGSSERLASAYGIAVSGTMVVTTLLLAVVARERWNWSLPLTVAVIGAFGIVDVAFFLANALKVADGGWFPLLVGALVFIVMSTWHRGRELLVERSDEQNSAIDAFIRDGAPNLHRVKGTAVFLASPRATIPASLAENTRHNKVLHERVVLLTVVTEPVPYVAPERRMVVEPMELNISRVFLHFGFAEKPDVPAALASDAARFSIDLQDTSFFVGRALSVPGRRRGLAPWRERLFAFLSHNAVGASDYFGLPPARSVEIGMQIDL